jgi:hypothetical protein
VVEGGEGYERCGGGGSDALEVQAFTIWHGPALRTEEGRRGRGIAVDDLQN